MKQLFYSIFLLISVSGFSQDIHFSQFDETPLQINPSNAGLQFATRVNVNYKTQWQSVNAPFKTMAASADVRFFKTKKHHIAAGIDFFSDNAANSTIKSTQANLSVSGIINMNKMNKLSAGLMAGYGIRRLDVGSSTWGNQYNGLAYDGSRLSGEPQVTNAFGFVDLGAGIQYSHSEKEMYVSANNAKNVNIGFAVFHPHKPNYSFYENTERLYAKFVFHGDAAIGIPNSNVVLKPSYIVFLQGPSKEITPGMTVQYVLGERSKYTRIKKFTAFSIGGYYRLKDAAIAVAKLEWAGYSIGFSYDINLSKLRTVSSTRGGFEISLHMGIPRQPKGTAGASRLGIFS